MQQQKLLTLRWRSFLGDSSDLDASIFALKGGQYFVCVSQQPSLFLIIRLTGPKIDEASLMLISRIGQRACLYPFYV